MAYRLERTHGNTIKVQCFFVFSTGIAAFLVGIRGRIWPRWPFLYIIDENMRTLGLRDLLVSGVFGAAEHQHIAMES